MHAAIAAEGVRAQAVGAAEGVTAQAADRGDAPGLLVPTPPPGPPPPEVVVRAQAADRRQAARVLVPTPRPEPPPPQLSVTGQADDQGEAPEILVPTPPSGSPSPLTVCDSDEAEDSDRELPHQPLHQTVSVEDTVQTVLAEHEFQVAADAVSRALLQLVIATVSAMLRRGAAPAA